VTTHPSPDAEPRDHRQEFAAFLRDLMNRRGFDTTGFDTKGIKRPGGPSQLASSAGLTLTVVLRLIKGEVVPTVPTLQRLADALDVPMGELLLQAGLARTPHDLAFWPRPEWQVPEDWEAVSDPTGRVTILREKPLLDQFGEVEKQVEEHSAAVLAAALADADPPDDLPAHETWENTDVWERHIWHTPGVPWQMRVAALGIIKAMMPPREVPGFAVVEVDESDQHADSA
jgi:transcriptional regulator with XRE-family HTH domain